MGTNPSNEKNKGKKTKAEIVKQYHLREVSFLCKYVFSFILIILASQRSGQLTFWFGTFELLLAALLTNVIRKDIARNIFNDVLILLLNVQMCVLLYGNTYVTLVMITNLEHIQDLTGRASYVLAAIFSVGFAFLPVRRIRLKARTSVLLTGVLSLELIFCMFAGNSYSPYYAYLDLIRQRQERYALKKQAEEANVDKSYYYKEKITGHIDKPVNLPEQPNVVCIFVEGLSQNIVEDPRGIMENVAAYEKKSLNFTDYFNHTFATFRGISGQLYSGYQENNYDENTLISLQDVLKDEGYHTIFINSEPNNTIFTSFLADLGFDTLVSNVGHDYEGLLESLSDREAYEELFRQMEQASGEKDPFFISMYTFGTHASWNSVNKKFGDGSDQELNKFYEADYYFGEFMEKFEKSDMAKDTIIVFTSDHATYQDEGFDKAFPNADRTVVGLDRIPLFFYYKGIAPADIDAKGRNSLDLAPTICDYLDISAENYFLGDSLFMSAELNNNYDTVYSSESDVYTTRGGVITTLPKETEDIFLDGLYGYFYIKQGE